MYSTKPYSPTTLTWSLYSYLVTLLQSLFSMDPSKHVAVEADSLSTFDLVSKPLDIVTLSVRSLIRIQRGRYVSVES